MLINFQKSHCILTQALTNLPFHYNQQTLGVVVNIFIEVNDGHHMLASRGTAVQLHLASCLWAVPQHLEQRTDVRPVSVNGQKY